MNDHLGARISGYFIAGSEREPVLVATTPREKNRRVGRHTDKSTIFVSSSKGYSKRMRIALIYPAGKLLPQTGTSARTLGFIRALVNCGHKVVFVGPDREDNEERDLLKSLGVERVKIRKTDCKLAIVTQVIYAIRLVKAIREANQRLDFDILQFVNYNTNILAYPLIKIMLRGIMVSDLHAHGSQRFIEPGLPKPFLVWIYSLILENLALRFSDVILTPTAELHDACSRKLRHSKKVFAVPNCQCKINERKADLGFAAAKGEQVELLKKETEFIVFFHANFLPSALAGRRSIREIQRLLEIVRHVSERGPRVTLWVAGPGSRSMDGWMNNPENVRMLGYVKDPAWYMSQSDLAILPVKDLTLGIHSRLIDAMVEGKPVVATKEACCGLLRHLGDSGIILCNSIEEMADSAYSLLKDPIYMGILGKRNKELANRLFSTQAVGMQLKNAYLAGHN